jgi:hypothetical protein
MAPKVGSKGVAQPKAALPSVLDLTFPLWTDVTGDKETPGASPHCLLKTCSLGAAA